MKLRNFATSNYIHMNNINNIWNLLLVEVFCRLKSIAAP